MRVTAERVRTERGLGKWSRERIVARYKELLALAEQDMSPHRIAEAPFHCFLLKAAILLYSLDLEKAGSPASIRRAQETQRRLGL